MAAACCVWESLPGHQCTCSVKHIKVHVSQLAHRKVGCWAVEALQNARNVDAFVRNPTANLEVLLSPELQHQANLNYVL